MVSRVNQGMDKDEILEGLVDSVDDLTSALNNSSKQANLYNLILGLLTFIIAVLTALMLWEMVFP